MKAHLLKPLSALLLVGVVLILLPACNTVKGAGKDLEKTGEAIQDAAE